MQGIKSLNLAIVRGLCIVSVSAKCAVANTCHRSTYQRLQPLTTCRWSRDETTPTTAALTANVPEVLHLRPFAYLVYNVPMQVYKSHYC